MAEMLDRPYPDAFSDLVLETADDVFGELPTPQEPERQVREGIEKLIVEKGRASAGKSRPPPSPYSKRVVVSARRSALMFGMLTRAREAERAAGSRRAALVLAVAVAWVDARLAAKCGADIRHLASQPLMLDLYGFADDVLSGRMGSPKAGVLLSTLESVRLVGPPTYSPGPLPAIPVERAATSREAGRPKTNQAQHDKIARALRDNTGHWLSSADLARSTGLTPKQLYRAMSRARTAYASCIEKSIDSDSCVLYQWVGNTSAPPSGADPA
jgi:hypothetical protein